MLEGGLNQRLERNLTLHLHIHIYYFYIGRQSLCDIKNISELSCWNPQNFIGVSTHPMNSFCALKSRGLCNTKSEGFLNKNLIFFLNKENCCSIQLKSWSQLWLSTICACFILPFQCQLCVILLQIMIT